MIDFNDELEQLAGPSSAGCVVLANDGVARPLRRAPDGRRRGRGAILAFLDDDACADPDWLERSSASTTIRWSWAWAARSTPAWEGQRPAWFPPEFDWVIGCTYAGMPHETARVRNPIGANMSMRATVFGRLVRLIHGSDGPPAPRP